MKNQTQIFQVIFLLKTIKELRKIQQIRGKKRKKKKKKGKKEKRFHLFLEIIMLLLQISSRIKRIHVTLKMLCLQMNQFVGKKKFMINELDSIIKNLV